MKEYRSFRDTSGYKSQVLMKPAETQRLNLSWCERSQAGKGSVEHDKESQTATLYFPQRGGVWEKLWTCSDLRESVHTFTHSADTHAVLTGISSFCLLLADGNALSSAGMFPSAAAALQTQTDPFLYFSELSKHQQHRSRCVWFAGFLSLWLLNHPSFLLQGRAIDS